MTVLTEVGAAVLVALLRGGKIARLANLALEGLVFVWLSLLLRVVADVLAAYWVPAAAWLQAVAYLPLFYFILLNRDRAGLPLLGLGSALNLLVIAANGGMMPVSAVAIASAGGAGNVPVGTHTLLTGESRLSFLADVIPVPWHFPEPVVISGGDILITLGVFLFIQHQMLAGKAGRPRGSLAPKNR